MIISKVICYNFVINVSIMYYEGEINMWLNKTISIMLVVIILICTPLCTFANDVSIPSESLNETEADVVSALGSDIVFMSSNGKFFANGAKLDYSSYGSDAYLSDETVMVDKRVLEYAFGMEITADGDTVSIDGSSFKCEYVDGV